MVMLAACAGGSGGGAVDASDASGGDVEPQTDYLVELAAPEDFDRLASDNGAVKYLVTVPASPLPPLDAPCYFQDTTAYAWHVEFVRSFAGLEDVSNADYVAWAVEPAPGERKLWAGALRRWGHTRHPVTQAQGVYSFSIYATGTGLADLTAADIDHVYQRLRACAPAIAEQLVFVPDGVPQELHVEGLAGELQQLGVPWLSPLLLASRAFPFHATLCSRSHPS